MTTQIEHHEELLNATISETIFDFQAHILKLAKSEVIEDNPLKDYIEKAKRRPGAKEIAHNLIAIKVDEKFNILNYETDYSNIRIYSMTFEATTAFFIDFEEKDSGDKTPIRLMVVCDYNLMLALQTNYNKKNKDSISNGNFILCELLELAAYLATIE